MLRMFHSCSSFPSFRKQHSSLTFDRSRRPRYCLWATIPIHLWSDSGAGLFNMSLFTLGVTLGHDTHVARCCGVCRIPWERLPSNLDRPALFTSGATPERAMLEGVIPFQSRVHVPWERLSGRTPLCAVAVIPFTRAPSPRPAPRGDSTGG